MPHDLDAILQAAGESACRDAVAAGWAESLASFSEGERRGLLAPEAVAANAEFAGFTGEEAARVAAAAARLSAVPGLDLALWHCHRLVFRTSDSVDFKAWPSWRSALGDAAGAFYLLAGLAGVPDIRAAHRGRGVSEDVTRDTCRQLRDFCANHERGHGGRLGIYRLQIGWMRHYAREPYYRLGRMEYWLKPFSAGVRAWRHRATGRVVALAEDGKKLDGEGQVDGSAGRWDKAGGWVARLVETEREVVGFPYSPEGMAVRREVRLPLADWEPVLRPDVWVLEMHIPAGGSMGPEACRRSHEMALEFFDRHHPEHPWVAMVCNSWIFNTQLERILPADSNLVRYMRDLYLYPVRSSGHDGLWFVFLQEPVDLKTAPRESSLQRAILEFLEAGNVWRGGAMFILREHAALIGGQHYRRQWSGVLDAL